MALDEPKENDLKVTTGDFNFVIENDLAQNIGDVNIDFIDSWLGSGFVIEAVGSSSC